MSDQKLRVSLITPTYNERENIALLTEEIFGVLKAHPDIDLELIVVDDNSPDGTARWPNRSKIATRCRWFTAPENWDWAAR